MGIRIARKGMWPDLLASLFLARRGHGRLERGVLSAARYPGQPARPISLTNRTKPISRRRNSLPRFSTATSIYSSDEPMGMMIRPSIADNREIEAG